MFYIDLKLKIYEKEAALSTLPVSLPFFVCCRRRPSKKKRHEIIEIIKLTDLKGLRDIIFIFSSSQSVLERVFRYKLNKITIL
jgi:hypothetical protein